MARKFLTAIDLNTNELQNAVIQNLASDPGGVAGRIYYNTAGDLKFYDGTAWKTINTGTGSFTLGSTYITLGSTTTTLAGLSSVTSTTFVGALTGNASTATSAGKLTTPITVNGTTGVDWSNSTYTFTAAAGTLTGNTLNSTVLYSSLTSVGTLSSLTMGGAIAMGNSKITGLATPTNDTDAANKGYVDNAVAGLTWKESVNLLATANIPLTGNTNTVTIDGHATLTSTHSGYRLLLTAQTTAADKGIYDYTDNGTTYTLTRSTDADTYQELIGATVFIEEGTAYGNTAWTQSNHYLTSFASQSWVQFSGASTTTAGAGLVKNGVAFDVVGTADRITVGPDSVDIASTYVGQTSITTLGTIGTGTWNATTIATNKGGTGLTSFTSGGAVYATSTSALTTGTLPVASGGTGATSAAGAKTNLGFTTKYTATNASLTPSGGIVTWSIPQSTHGLAANSSNIVQVNDVSTGEIVSVDVVVAEASGNVTLSWNSSSSVSAGAYRVTIIG